MDIEKKQFNLTYSERGKPYLSNDSKAYLIQLLKEGKSKSEIAKKCGLSRQWMHEIIERNGISEYNKRLLVKGTKTLEKEIEYIDNKRQVIPKTIMRHVRDNGLSYKDIRNIFKLIVSMSKGEITGIKNGDIPASLEQYFTSFEDFPIMVSIVISALAGDVNKGSIENLLRLIDRIYTRSEIDGNESVEFNNILNVIMSYIPKLVNKTFASLFGISEEDKPEVILYGSAGSGKSVTAANYIVFKILQHEENNALILRKESNTLDTSVVHEIKKVLEYHNIPYVFNKTAKIITCNLYGREKQEIYFRGLDDVQKLLSIVPTNGSLTHVWIEEAIATTQDDYDVVSTRIRGGMREKQIILTLNPFSKESWIYKRWFADESEDNQNITRSFRHKSTWKDNPYLTDGDKQRLHMLKKNNPRLAKVLLDGEWGVLGDRVFDDENFVIAETEPNWGSLTLLAYGVDFGFKRDPSAIIGVYMDEINNGQIYARELYYGRIPAVEDLAVSIHGLSANGYLDLTARFYCDTQPPDAVEVLNRRNIWAIPAIKGAGSILNGIQSIIALKPIIWGENLVREFSEYVYKKDKNGNTGNPEDLNNHLIDAFRYAICDIKLFNGGAY